ncbi:uncharacterized protein DUF222 [Glaciihabitans tibetensis]|uniref:Uncharacterized protein DUF222 n=1 Tax=Glaciihabitans tibetensis TaxID=1266600 RepID=A0A2T0VKC3_9MICO|nr:HNH endonuclease signature motif containing protein [Glaciihabitans tibetensis]PRY70575.1 uncharacterized protein DUF222 [Glaciihabitans tibetensis]
MTESDDPPEDNFEDLQPEDLPSRLPQSEHAHSEHEEPAHAQSEHSQSGYAQSGYAQSEDAQSEYAHSGYATQEELAALSALVAENEKFLGPFRVDDADVPDEVPQDWAFADIVSASVSDAFIDPNEAWLRGIDRAGLIDDLIAVENAEAVLHARRTVLIERYRALCTNTSVPVRAASVPSGWSPEVITRREMITEIATATRKAEATVEQLFADAEILHSSLPSTMDAMFEGRISYRHATVIASQAQDVPEEMRHKFEETVLPVAATATVPRLKQRARIVRERMHPESIDVRAKKAVRGRYLEVDPAGDGMATLTAKLPAVEAVGIYNRCTETAIALQGPDEDRSLGQLRTDVFRDILLNGEIPVDSPARTVDGGDVLAGAAATGIRATVVVMVPALTLLNRSDEPATLEGYGPIDHESAKVLAAGANSWIRVLTHPETGTVLSVGQTRYKVPASMRLWLRLRDQTCRYPGCNRSAKYCDLDHVLDWQYGGHTSTENLQHLCPAHHNVKGYTSWTVRHLDNGILEWVSPAGRSHITEPAIPIGFASSSVPAAPPPASPPAPVYGFTEAWERMEADTDDDGWYAPPTGESTPF